MICLEKAEDFTRELGQLMEKYGVAVFIDDMQGFHNHCLEIGLIQPDLIQHYIDDLLDNTPRK